MAFPAPAIAVDLGGTQIRAGLVVDGQLCHRLSEPTASERGIDAVITSIADLVRTVQRQANRGAPLPVGVATPGPLDPRTGLIYEAPNLQGWYNVPLGEQLRERLQTRVFIVNDANAAAVGEHRFGAGQNVANLVYVTLSTGIGGGLILENRLFEGTGGAAGEIGHMVLDVAGPACNCGGRGCWEALASGTAIAAHAQAAVDQGQAPALTALARLAGGRVRAADVTQAAREGDPVALAILERAGTITGFGLVNLAHLFDPDLIVLGGGVTHAGDLVLGPAFAIYERYAMPNYRRTCQIVLAGLGDDAGLYGAAAQAAEAAAHGV